MSNHHTVFKREESQDPKQTELEKEQGSPQENQSSFPKRTKLAQYPDPLP